MSSPLTNVSSVSTDAILRALDEHFSRAMLPVSVYLAVVIALGLPGNLLVYLVYVTKFKVTSTRFFIMALAVLDLLNLTLGAPVPFVIIHRKYTFPAAALCKEVAFVNAFCAICSVLVLLVVAVDRYRKICLPFSTQLTPGGAVKATLGCCGLALTLVWPLPVFWGMQVTPTEVPGVNGTTCSLENAYLFSPYPLIYYGAIFLLFLGVFTALVVIYSLIYRQDMEKYARCLFQIRRQRNLQSLSINEVAMLLHATTFPSSSHVSDTIASDIVGESSSEAHGASAEAALPLPEQATLGLPGGEQVSQPASPQSPRTKVRAHVDEEARVGTCAAPCRTSASMHSAASRNTLLTLSLVTLAYILSFLPFLLIYAVRGASPRAFEDTSVLVQLCSRSHYIQSVSNPFIYGFLNPQFRTQCRQMLLCRKR